MPHARPRPKQRNLHSGTRRYFANCGRGVGRPFMRDFPSNEAAEPRERRAAAPQPVTSDLEGAIYSFLGKTGDPLQQVVGGAILAVLTRETDKGTRGQLRAILDAVMRRTPGYEPEHAIQAVLEGAEVPAADITRKLRLAARRCKQQCPANQEFWQRVGKGLRGNKPIEVDDLVLQILLAAGDSSPEVASG